MDTIIVLLLALVFIMEPAECGRVCSVENMEIASWYEPEYEYVSYVIEPKTRNVTIVDGQETETHRDHTMNYGFQFGLEFPPQIYTGTIDIPDSTDDVHVLEYASNGTHVCMAINVVVANADGSTSHTCTQQCQPNFDATWTDIEILTDTTTTEGRDSRDYLSIRVLRGQSTTSLDCYKPRDNGVGDPRASYCEPPKRCVIVVTQETTDSPYQFHPRCQPDEVTCSDVPTEAATCVTDTTAPYIGDGQFAEVCTYCCGYHGCNDVRNCSSTDGTCRTYGQQITTTTEAPTTTEDSSGTSGARELDLAALSRLVSMLCVLICYIIV